MSQFMYLLVILGITSVTKMRITNETFGATTKISLSVFHSNKIMPNRKREIE